PHGGPGRDGGPRREEPGGVPEAVQEARGAALHELIRLHNFSRIFSARRKTGRFLSVPLRIVVLAASPTRPEDPKASKERTMHKQQRQARRPEPGLDFPATAEQRGVRLATASDPSLPEDTTGLF